MVSLSRNILICLSFTALLLAQFSTLDHLHLSLSGEDSCEFCSHFSYADDGVEIQILLEVDLATLVIPSYVNEPVVALLRQDNCRGPPLTS